MPQTKNQVLLLCLSLHCVLSLFTIQMFFYILSQSLIFLDQGNSCTCTPAQGNLLTYLHAEFKTAYLVL